MSIASQGTCTSVTEPRREEFKSKSTDMLTCGFYRIAVTVPSSVVCNNYIYWNSNKVLQFIFLSNNSRKIYTYIIEHRAKYKNMTNSKREESSGSIYNSVNEKGEKNERSTNVQSCDGRRRAWYGGPSETPAVGSSGCIGTWAGWMALGRTSLHLVSSVREWICVFTCQNGGVE